MAKRGKKGKRRVNYGKLISRLIIISILIYSGYTLLDQHREMKYLDAQEEKLLERLAAEEKEIQDLKDQIENGNTDEHIEKIARKHLKMIGQDEIIFIDTAREDI